MDFLLSFSAGLLSFLSPCVLPLIPAYVSYITGTTVAEIKSASKGKTLVQSVFFVAGFSLIFILLGLSVSSLGELLSKNLELFKKLGGILVILFGLHMTGLIKIKALYSEKRLRLLSDRKATGRIGALVLGMAFAAGWTPCVGPILSSILVYAGSTATISKGLLLLTAYSLGLAVPFVLSALLIRNFTLYFQKFSKFLPAVSVISGILMIGMGILLFTDKLTMISRLFGA